MTGEDGQTRERRAETSLVETINGTGGIDAAVLLELDAVYDEEGNRDETNMHFYVANDYMAELAEKHPKILFGDSIHPYHKDAVVEAERCVGRGAFLVKWLAEQLVQVPVPTVAVSRDLPGPGVHSGCRQPSCKRSSLSCRACLRAFDSEC